MMDSKQEFTSRSTKEKKETWRWSKRTPSLLEKPIEPAYTAPSIVRKYRRKEIEKTFGKYAYRPLPGLVYGSGNQSWRGVRKASIGSGASNRGCTWSFIFDPSGRLAYWWSSVVSAAFTYNLWVIIYRVAIEEIDSTNAAYWFVFDYTSDLLYTLDIVFRFRTGFLDDGVLQTDTFKLRLRYMNSTLFYADCLSLLPLDFLYLSFGFKSAFRCFRLVKIYRFWSFVDWTERHTNWPNVLRSLTLLHYVLVTFHWNACFNVILARSCCCPNATSPTTDDDDDDGGGGKGGMSDGDFIATYRNNGMEPFFFYLRSFYRSSIHVTSATSMRHPPSTKTGFLFAILQFVFGLLLFAAILGHVATIVTSVSAARKDFQARLDLVKNYMNLRGVPSQLQARVIRWFDYLWSGSYKGEGAVDEDKTLDLLPDKLRSEIALHVHLDTLKRVEIFQSTEVGFLRELVLKMKTVLYSPGDSICRKGEVGREMFIVSRGELQVVSDDGKVLATLKSGSYFGELSILNTGGNRRTASVKSVGYSDLFCLSKVDLWDVLKDYPKARIRLEAIALKKMQVYKKEADEKERQGMFRNKSAPSLVESSGRIPLFGSRSFVPHGTLNKSNRSPGGNQFESGKVSTIMSQEVE